MVEDDLGPIENVFSWFDDEACGSASIAQAHRATTVRVRVMMPIYMSDCVEFV